MTLTQLEYIIAVDTHRHFAKAAEDSFVTQPTLSMQIHKLEESLGVTIFDRSKQPVEVTEIGQKIIEQARIVLKETRRMQEIIADVKNEISGSIRLGIIPTLAPYLLPRFITGFLKQYPKVQIQVEELVTDDILQKIKNEQLDAGLLVTPVDDVLIEEKPLFYEEFMAYVSGQHVLADKKELQPDELVNEEVWLLNQGHCFREQVLNLCGKHSSALFQNFQYESGSLEALRNLVNRHGGLTLLPELAIENLNKKEQEKLKPFTDPKPVREVSLVMHKNFVKRKLLEALYKEVAACVPDKMKEPLKGKIVRWK